MELNIKEKQLRIEGMTCVSCQNKIARKLQNTVGVKSAKVNYSVGTAYITYDANKISLSQIATIIEKLDYKVLRRNARRGPDVRQVIEILAIIISLYVLLEQFGILNLLVPSKLADNKMGYGMLFIIGMVTSVHCIAMCGGINLSQCIPSGDVSADKQGRFATLAPSFLYNLGRVTSYTAIGFILGFAGWIFGGGDGVGMPIVIQGIFKLIAGIFMVIMGINILGLFPALRKLNPRMPRFLVQKVGAEKAHSKSPLFVGLLNGFMPCGPLQSMKIIALATANPLAGALSMFVFSLGTVPLMLGVGSIVSALGKKFTKGVMAVGAVLVVVLGLAMLSQGGSLSGLLPPALLLPIIIAFSAVGVVSIIPFQKRLYKAISTVVTLIVAIIFLFTWNSWNISLQGNNNQVSSIQIVDGKQIVSSTLSSSSYPSITLQAGIPVKWNIYASDGSINGCNNRIFIKEYGIEYTFKPGDNFIEFIPEKTGEFTYNCWMGMIRANITVIESGEGLSGVNSALDISKEDS